MINGTLQEFVRNVNAKGQIRYGDVRRLQRDYLPNGITHDEELELLISLNANLVRADRAWEQWLVASVSDFVARQQGGKHAKEEAEGVGCRFLAASKTNRGRRIARQARRELGRRHGPQSANSDQAHLEARPNDGSGHALDDRDDCSRGRSKLRQCRRSETSAQSRPRHRIGRRMIRPAAMTLAGSADGGCLLVYLPAFQRSHLINFQGSSASLVLGPCR